MGVTGSAANLPDRRHPEDLLRASQRAHRPIGNLHKERSSDLIPIATEAVNGHAEPPITAEEVKRYYSRDARMWALLQRLRRMDRGWQQHVRRRTYHSCFRRESTARPFHV